jgi:curli biogenesis system outer membrane secretion channel CsgG
MADKVGSQARSILLTHLQQFGAFRIYEGVNDEGQTADAPSVELPTDNRALQYSVSGDILESGRKETGDYQLGGLLGFGRQQVMYAKISLRLVKQSTKEIIYTGVGEGTYQTNQRDILSFGSYSGFDPVLNGKVLDLAIVDAVNALTGAVNSGSVKLP